MTRLTVGVPCHGGWKAEMGVSLVMSLAQLGLPIHMSVTRGPYVHDNRETIFSDAVKAGSTHLWFVDTDMVFLPDGIQKLLALKKPIVGGNYNTKSTPPVSTVKLADADGKYRNVPPEEIPREPFRCGAVATGFMLIDLEAVTSSTMKPPYFDFARASDGSLVGEDVLFCQRAREAGLEVWCDPTIQLGHIGDQRY